MMPVPPIAAAAIGAVGSSQHRSCKATIGGTGDAAPSPLRQVALKSGLCLPVPLNSAAADFSAPRNLPRPRSRPTPGPRSHPAFLAGIPRSEMIGPPHSCWSFRSASTCLRRSLPCCSITARRASRTSSISGSAEFANGSGGDG